MVIYINTHAAIEQMREKAEREVKLGPRVGYSKGPEEQISLVVRKPVFGVSDQVPHKPGCTATEDG